MQINRYTVSNLSSKTDLKPFEHSKTGLDLAIAFAKEEKRENPENDYVVIETKMIDII